MDFRRYTLQIVAVKDADEAAALRREVEAGTTLESLIPKYSLNLGIPGGSNRLAHQSLQQLSYRLGPYLAEAVQLLKPGQLSLPVPSPLGLLVFRLESVQGGYAESRQRLEDLMVASDCLDWITNWPSNRWCLRSTCLNSVRGPSLWPALLRNWISIPCVPRRS